MVLGRGRTALSDTNRQTFADILGIEKWLVDDLHTILVALSSGLDIDSQKFKVFCHDLAVKYVKQYNWFYMSVTVHKILIHGANIIEAISLPIGMLSEQAGESRNKYWRYDREHHTRKLSRKITILDLFHRALESSDPLISTMSIANRQKKNKRSVLPAKVLSLLKPFIDNVIIHDQLQTSTNNDSTELTSDDKTLVLSSEDFHNLSDDDNRDLK